MKNNRINRTALILLNISFLVLAFISLFGINVFIPLLIIAILTGLAFIFIRDRAFNIRLDNFKVWFNILMRAAFYLSTVAVFFNVYSYPGNKIISLIAILLILFTIFYSLNQRSLNRENNTAYITIITYAVVYHMAIVFSTPVL